MHPRACHGRRTWLAPLAQWRAALVEIADLCVEDRTRAWYSGCNLKFFAGRATNPGRHAAPATGAAFAHRIRAGYFCFSTGAFDSGAFVGHDCGRCSPSCCQHAAARSAVRRIGFKYRARSFNSRRRIKFSRSCPQQPARGSPGCPVAGGAHQSEVAFEALTQDPIQTRGQSARSSHAG